MESPPWSPPSISITQPLPQTLLFFISNFHYLIPIKLTDHNYSIWKLQCEGALKATSLFDHIQQSQPPSPTILDSTGKTIGNPMFFTWFVVETHLRSCLIATLTPDVLTLVRHASSVRDLWLFLKQKFEKSNSFEEFDLQDSSPVICQICGNEGHGALDCSNRYVEDSQPANSTMASASYADEVFDGSPDRNDDGSAVSAAITGSDNVTPPQGMAVLFEPEMWVLNHSESSLVDDRLSVSPEEMIGCQTRQEIVNFELFQKKPEPQISEAKEKVILMTQPENNLSESKPKVPTPVMDGSSDLCSDSLKKNKMFCYPANSKPNTGNNNDIGPSPKETRTAVENTRSTDDQKIQNSHENKKGGKSHDGQKIQNSHENKKGGKSHDGQKIQNSHENKKGGKSHDGQKIQNSHENKKGGKSHDGQKIQNSHENKKGGKSHDGQKIQNSHENKKGGKSHDGQKIQNSHENKKGGKSHDGQKIQNSHENKKGGKSHDGQKIQNSHENKKGGKSHDGQKIQNSHEDKKGGKSHDGQKIQNSRENKKGGKSHDGQKIQNSHENKKGGKSHDGQKIQNSHENKKGGKSHDGQKIQNSHENKKGGKSHDGQKIQNSRENKKGGKSHDDQKIQNPQEIQDEGNALQVDKQVNGDQAVVLVGTSDDDQKTQNSPEIQVEGNALQVALNKKLNSGKATIQVNGQLNGGKWISWSRPPPGMVALHFDGSLRDGTAAGGGVFRDHCGQFMAAFSAHLGSSNDSNEAEANALLSGLRFAHYWNIPVHCIYGDSFVVVKAVTGNVVNPGKLLPTVQKIRKLLNGAAISHTHREGNQVADELAARGHCLSSGSTKPYLLQEDLPALVRILLFQDCHDCKTYRPP